MSVTIEITIEAGDWEKLCPAAFVRRAAETALSSAGVTEGEVGILLTDDAHVRALNRKWRAEDAPTNVLSFPSPSTQPTGPRFLGDVALAFETVMREAQAEGKSADHHVAHLVVHGVLHLLGHDHQTDDQAQAMERQERTALARVGVPDPYWADPAGERIP
jgi:probable rRNA maturation factor